ncbi:MAG: hypothetical protein QXI07_00770 [Pyrobaculum sp.]
MLFLADRGLTAALILALLLAYASHASDRLYVYLVESDVELEDLVPHVPGARWALGEQALVIYVPRDVGVGVVLFTNETVEVPIYDRRYFLLAVPAGARPSNMGGDAVLRTPDGVLPVVFRKPDGGVVDMAARSVEEALEALRRAGYQPEYRGRGRLEKPGAQPRRPENVSAGQAQISNGIGVLYGPSGTLDVYGGIYFKPVRITSRGVFDVPVHGSAGSVCVDVPNAAYVGYKARSLVVGVLILGGSASGELIAEVYQIHPGTRTCTLVGRRSYPLLNKSRVWVSGVNEAASAGMPLAVRLRVNATSYTGSPRVGANASVLYTRVRAWGFEVAEMVYSIAEGQSGTSISRRTDRLVVGPYTAFDGLVAGTFRSTVNLTVSTDPISGTCPDLQVSFILNARWTVSTKTYPGAYDGLVCIYRVASSFNLDHSEYAYAKSFGGGLFWVLTLRFSNGQAPYVRSVVPNPSDVFRSWRWAEQWKSDCGSVIDGSWKHPFTSAVLEKYASVTEPAPAPSVLHGLVTVGANYIGDSLNRLIVTISGRRVSGTGSAAYIDRAEVYLRLNKTVQGSEIKSANYLTPSGIVTVQPPQWVEFAQRIKEAADFILGLPGLGGRLQTLLSFLTGHGLQSAGGSYGISVINNYNMKLWWIAPWGGFTVSDTLIFGIRIPSTEISPSSSTWFQVTRYCLGGYCYTPNAVGYLQPTDGTRYGIEAELAKTWMFREMTSPEATYKN